MKAKKLGLVASLVPVLTTIGVISMSLPGSAQTMAIWMADLTEQAAAQYGCKIDFVSQVLEKSVDGRQTVLAKVLCEDGRAFDVYRPDSYTDFQFSECESRVRSSC